MSERDDLEPREHRRDGPGGPPSHEQEAAFDASRTDREATLAAVHRLESAAGMAGSGREPEWRDQVAADLELLEIAVAHEAEESRHPASLLSMIARDYPRRFGSRIRQLREQQDDIARTIGSLRAQVDAMAEGSVDVADLRRRLAWVVDAIRHRWARETDLVYEAISLDLGRPERETSGGPTPEH